MNRIAAGKGAPTAGVLAAFLSLAAAAVCPLAVNAVGSAGLSRDALQASLNRLAALEAHHDLPNWQKQVQSLFAPNAHIVNITPKRRENLTVAQYMAAEQKYAALTASATGTIEHDFVQSFRPNPTGAAAQSELTVHSREMTSQGMATVDVIYSRQYTIVRQGSSWRVSKLVIAPTALYFNGRQIGLVAPRKVTH